MKQITVAKNAASNEEQHSPIMNSTWANIEQKQVRGHDWNATILNDMKNKLQ
jgi:hypothetical protein